MDKKIGFDSSEKINLEAKLKEHNKTVNELKIKIQKLENEISNLKKDQVKAELPIKKYSLSKLVYPEEKFTNLNTGVKFSMSGVYKFKNEWFISANLTTPDSGDFKRDMLVSDTFEFFKDNKKFTLSFSEFNPENKTIKIQILEI